MFLGKIHLEQYGKISHGGACIFQHSLSLSCRLNNFSLMRSLDIHEDPTFIPEVAAEVTEDKSETKSTLDIIKQLIDTR